MILVRSSEVLCIILILLCAVLVFPSAMHLISTIISTTSAAPLLDPGQSFGAEANPTGSPVGGGYRYHDIITATDTRVNYTVDTTDEFLDALDTATEGDIVYVDEMTHINLTDIPGGVTIPAGVTLAGNRGERNTTGMAIYSFHIDEPGEYTLWGLASAQSPNNDSFWVSVDDEGIRQWNLELGSGWRWSREESFYLSAGEHTLTVCWREDGALLDRLLITGDSDYVPDTVIEERKGGRQLLIEAESGTLSPPMAAAADPTVSGGMYISVPEGNGMGNPVSPGGRIFLSAANSDQPLALTAGGEQVRITGLRIEGPDRTIEEINTPTYGIYSTYRNLQVDNCEIYGWSGAAINIFRTGGGEVEAGGYIHHNYIHHCQMDGLGYGVSVNQGAVSLIEANYFDYCRHAIAGTGLSGDGYEARYNICGPNFISNTAHNFDMHGKPDPSGTGTIAGDSIRIHHNTFLGTEPSSSFPVFIQGVPRVGAFIDHNWFYYDRAAPVWQSNGEGNISATNNLIGPEGTFLEETPIRYL